jgi:hypothetical protein
MNVLQMAAKTNGASGTFEVQKQKYLSGPRHTPQILFEF